MQVVVVASGAVGSVLGGLLALRNNDVLLVSRSRHARAIGEQGGLRLRSATGDYFARLQAVEQIDNTRFGDGTVCLVTCKSYDNETCAELLGRVAPPDLPVVTFQNGVAAEDVFASRFENVYGGVCRMTCSMIQPGHASFRRIGRIIVGRHPKGSDATARKLVSMFTDAGFRASVSRTISADKWLKLAVNTQSAFHAVIEQRDHNANEFFELKAGILEETQAVLKAARIKARSCDGQDPSIDEMIADLRRPRAAKATGGMKVHNSTWQNLYLKRDRLENAYFHEPLIELGRKHNVPVPYNEAALAMLDGCRQNGLGPESMRLGDVLQLVGERRTS